MKLQYYLFHPALVLSFLAGVAFSNSVFSGQAYKATLVKNSPTGHKVVGDIIVDTFGNKRLTTKQSGGLETIYIVNLQQHRRWVLDPENKIYIERPEEGSLIGLPDIQDASDPCKLLSDAVCTLRGEEKLNGRPVSRWEISVDVAGQRVSGTQWIDTEAGQVIKQESAGNYSTELRDFVLTDPAPGIFEVPAGYTTIR